MNYIWRDYSYERKYAVDKRQFLQYTEEDIGVELDGIRYINPLSRFSGIFNPLDGLEDGKLRAEQENVLFHYLAQLDRKCGIHYSSVVEYVLERELLGGIYGEMPRERYGDLTEKERQVIKNYLRCHVQSQGRRLYYREAVGGIFPGSRVYYYPDDDNMTVLYLPQEENEDNFRKLELVNYLFADFTMQFRYFWQYHFGIIDDEMTMRVDRIALY